jgi:lipopolysaccharide/colanic/teichoic acid biosynthesis glycosyltransferase
MLPVGAGSFLDHLAAFIASVREEELLVMPSFRCDGVYERSIRASTSSTVRVIQPSELLTALGEREPSDYLMVVDPAQWPIDDFDIDVVTRDNGDYRGFIHAIALGSDGERLREIVERDENGHVKRVQRVYDRANWPEVATDQNLLSIGPVWAMGGIRFTSLGELRSALAAKGVLSHDVPVAVDVANLSTEEGFLALNEKALDQAVREGLPPGFYRKHDAVLVGHGCHIHASARLIGPVILHSGAVVEERVTIIGPTVVGPGSLVGRGAMVAQSVLAAGTVVAAGITIRHRVVAGRWSKSSAIGDAQTPPASTRIRPVGECFADKGMTLPSYPAGTRQTMHLVIKRIMDVVLSLAALVVLAPIMIIVAVLIKWDSRGPVLFIHRREKRGAKEFPCLKFRTMVADAHSQQRALYKDNEVDGPQFMLDRDRDQRVTRVGRWVRATNIDELPQLINVLLGHMSLVGPRPSPFRENQICVPWRRARLSVRPGITGLWQLCRQERQGGDFHQWIFYDMAYARHFSIWLDLRILLFTVLSLGGRWPVPLSWLVGTNNLHGGRFQQTATT